MNMKQRLAIALLAVFPAILSAEDLTPSPSHDVSVSRNLATFNSIVK